MAGNSSGSDQLMEGRFETSKNIPGRLLRILKCFVRISYQGTLRELTRN